MLKEYLKEQSMSIYELAMRSGVPYSTLNDLANGKVQIGQCRVDLLQKISAAMDLTMEDICSICRTEDKVVRVSYAISSDESYEVDARIAVKSKNYHAKFDYEGEPVDLELCMVKEDTTAYIDEIAKWRTVSYIRERRIEDWE